MDRKKEKGAWEIMGIMPISDWRTPASRIPEQSVSSCHVVKKIIKEGDALPMAGVFGYDQALFAEDTTITVLRCGEREAMDERSVWMSDSPQELYSMWKLVARSEGPRVLVGGLGLGLLPNLLALRRDVNEVVVVENNPSIISMIKPHLNKKVKVIEGDFLEQMRELGRKGSRRLFRIFTKRPSPKRIGHFSRMFGWGWRTTSSMPVTSTGASKRSWMKIMRECFCF